MIIRSAGLALLLATSMTQAETASIFSSINMEPLSAVTSSSRTQPAERDESATVPTPSATEPFDAINGKLSQISAELTRELDERFERVTEADAFDALPAPAPQKAPSVASIHLP